MIGFLIQNTASRTVGAAGNAVGGVLETIKASSVGMFNKIAEFIPTLVGALVILLVGWFIAKMIKWAILRILKAIRFDSFIEKTQVDEYLAKGGITTKVSGIIASLFYWTAMLSVLLLFFNSLGLEAVSDLINQIVAYLPKIFIGIVLLVVGVYLANFIQQLVVTPLKNMDFKGAELVGKCTKYFILFTVISMVLSTLGIGGNIIPNLFNTFTTALIGGAGLGAAIAIGLGGKDKAAELIQRSVK